MAWPVQPGTVANDLSAESLWPEDWPGVMTMRNGFKICVWFVLFAALASLSFAGRPGSDCRKVRGRVTETLINPVGAPGDPVGRVLGTVTGALNGAETAIINPPGPQPGPGGTLVAETVNVFVTDAGDTLVTKGNAVFSPIPGTPNVQDTLTLEIQPEESTGRFSGATGTITLEGIGFNLLANFPGPPTPGDTYFSFRYKGTICGIGNNDHDEDWD